MTQSVTFPPGKSINLQDFDPGYHNDLDKASAREEAASLKERLRDLQVRLYAEGKQSLLIVLQAMDAGGKDGTIRKVFEGVNPQGVVVTSFKAPTPEELAHDYLWRIHQHTPTKGFIGIFNRSHYEDVLVVRVNELVPNSVWRKRYKQINAFEEMLSENGTRILKFFLHISKDEQKERFQERLDRPEKQWKFSLGDLPVRERWNDYMAAYQDALNRCNTKHAPWHIVPANRKWYRDAVVLRTIVGALEEMDPQFPGSDPGLSEVVIPD